MSKFDSDNDKTFDKLSKELDDFKKGIDDRARETEANKIINPEFIKKNTQFESLEDLFQAGGFQFDFDTVDADKLDQFISQNTRFACWDDLLGEAYELYLKKNLNI